MPAGTPYSDTPVPRSLADALAHGPIPLSAALRFASDLAGELRDLHEQSRAYGKLTSQNVLISSSGARLMPLSSYWDQAVPERDIQAFGNLLYQMLHGTPAPSSLTAGNIRIPASQSGPDRLRATSTKLALRCVSPRNPRLSMQQVATELRLLTVMVRQDDANSRPTEEPPAPQPILTKAPTTWTPPVEMLIDSPGAIPMPPPAPLQQPGIPLPSAVPDSGSTAPVVQLSPASFGQPRPKPPATEAPATAGPCPKCDCAVVYISRARSRLELLVERLKLPIVRCHRCYHRYVVVGRIKIPKDMPVGTARKFRPRKRHS